jgi:hypothetical protein
VVRGCGGGGWPWWLANKLKFVVSESRRSGVVGFHQAGCEEEME